MLIADGDAVLAASLSELLRHAGFAVATATRADEAIARIEQFRPDAMVAELDVPTVCGLRLCRHIRQQPWGGSVLVVAVSGLPNEHIRRTAIAAGVDRYLLKPLLYQDIAAVLAEVKDRVDDVAGAAPVMPAEVVAIEFQREENVPIGAPAPAPVRPAAGARWRSAPSFSSTAPAALPW